MGPGFTAVITIYSVSELGLGNILRRKRGTYMCSVPLKNSLKIFTCATENLLIYPSVSFANGLTACTDSAMETQQTHPSYLPKYKPSSLVATVSHRTTFL